MKTKAIGRYLCLILRHHPEKIGIQLDEYGWANVDELIEGVNRRWPFDMEMLEWIVANDNKQRYSFNDDHTLIRCNQGHSIPVDVELPVKIPPAHLYHGTGIKSCEAIESEGLKPMSRLYVHLSSDVKTAIAVGKRHGQPVVYDIDTAAMAKDGYTFYLSVNNVWLCKHVPPQYLTKSKDNP